MSVLADIIAVLVAASGWYYLFYSRAAQKLESVEARNVNLTRVRLRRIGGGAMAILGGLIFAGAQEIRPVWFIVVWSGVLFLLLTIVILALIDVRLTWKLQKVRRRPPL
ncbi:MAG TPA: hypothetical protein VLJ39_05360 [Tepidisphaeraceae bacterium]|nr:hypothetical protein [Tepidisphaeraceae bacterium]